MGFELKTSHYYIKNDWGKAFNKVGFNSNGISVTLKLCSKVINVEFGHIKNLWLDSENNFWADWHSNAKKLNYLENKSLELMIFKFLNKYPNNPIEREIKYEGAEFIINSHKKSNHCKDISKLDDLGLGGIKYQMSEYDLGCNSLDQNQKKIECGTVKYFYRYGKLMRGEAYHNLNNMWWLLCNGCVNNIANFELFDYNDHADKKELTKDETLNKLNIKLRKLENNKQYLRCNELHNHIKRFKKNETFYRVYSIKWGQWWRANNSGYTSNEGDAGLYSESNVMANKNYYDDGKINKLVKLCG